jgi:phage repressor protein C with HTH and peptisase S24 domain
MSTVGERVAKAREKAGLNQTQLAKAIKVSPQAIQHLEASPTATSRYLIAIARALKVSSEWLESGKGRMEDPAREPAGSLVPVLRDNLVEIAGSEFARLPVYDIRFAAGAGSVNYDEEPVDYHMMSMHFLRTLSDAPVGDIAIFQARGDSMEDTIGDRDWVMADMRRRTLGTPGIYAMVFDGEGLLKRVSQHLETKAVTLISDNPKYPPQTIKNPNRLHVVGHVFSCFKRC